MCPTLKVRATWVRPFAHSQDELLESWLGDKDWAPVDRMLSARRALNWSERNPTGPRPCHAPTAQATD